MTLRDRIIKFINYKGISTREFEQSVSLSNGAVSKMGYSTRETTIDKISNIYPEINIHWLRTGEGQMLHTDDGGDGPSMEAPRPADSTGIPLVPIEVLAGTASLDNAGITLQECPMYRIPEFQRLGVEFMIRVSGSSMYPKYSNGDILACKKIHEIRFFQWGKVYVIDSSQGMLVKRVFADPDNPDNILLVSDNREHYPPFAIPKEDIRSLSLVLGVIRMD